MKPVFALAMIFVLLLAGCPLSQENSWEGQTTDADNLTIQSDLSKGIITKASFENITTEHLSTYKYKAKDNVGAALWSDSYVNAIEPTTNTFLDCELFDCTIKVKVSPSKALLMDGDFIKAACSDPRITFSKLFFYETKLVQKTRATYSDKTTEECFSSISNATGKDLGKNTTTCQNVTTQIENGTEIYFENESVRNENLTSITSDMQINLPMHRPSPSIIADCWYVVGGQERKEAAWWNASYAYRMPINCTLIDAGTPIVINGSGGFYIGGNQQVVWTRCDNANLSVYYNNFSDYVVANDTAQVPTEVELGNGTNYNPAAIWTSPFVNAVGVWHGTGGATLIDSANYNNISASNGSCISQTTGAVIGYAMNSSSTCTWGNAAVKGFPTGNGNRETSAWVFKTADTDGWVFSFGSAVSQRYNIMYKPVSTVCAGQICFEQTQVTGLNVTNLAWNSVGVSHTTSQGAVTMYVNKTAASGALGGLNEDLGATNKFYLFAPFWAPAGYGGGIVVDEIRIYNTTHNATFREQVYNNTLGLAGYGMLGANETGPTYGNLTVNYTAGGSASGNNSSFTSPANLTINATASAGYSFTGCMATTGNCSIVSNASSSCVVQANDGALCNVQANFATICQTFSTAGTSFTMQNSTTINGATCFNVTAANVTLNCAGYSITGSNASNTYGIYSNQLNTDIWNCTISNFSEGIRYDAGATDGTMGNNTITTTFNGGNGIRLTSAAHRNNLTSNTITNGNASGIYIDGGSNVTVDCQGDNIMGSNYSDTYGVYSNQTNTTIKNCGISGFESAARLESANNSLVQNNTISALTGTALYAVNSSYLNITGNSILVSSYPLGIYGGSNYVSIWNNTMNSTTTGVISMNDNGYGISNLNLSNNTLSGNASAESVALYTNGGSGQNFSLGQNNTVAGNRIYGRSGLNSCGNNFLVRDNVIAVILRGMEAWCFSQNQTYINNTITTSAGLGFQFGGGAGAQEKSSSNNILFANNTINATGGNAFSVNYLNSSGFTITNNTFISSTSNAASIKGSNITFANNSLFSNSGVVLAITQAFNNTFADNTLVSGGNAANLLVLTAHANTTNNIFSGNIFSNTSGNQILDGGHNDFYFQNTWNTTTGSALNITGQNNSIDCQGASLNGANVNLSYGIRITGFNTTIKNCNISNFEIGIYVNSANNTVTNDTISVSKPTCAYPYCDGIYATSNADYSVFTNITASSTNYGLFGDIGADHISIIGGNYTSNSSSVHGALRHLGRDSTISGATATATTAYGFVFSGSNNTISSISATGGSYAGAYIYQTSTAVAQNNTIANSTFTSASSNAILMDVNATGNTLYNNTLISGGGAATLLRLTATVGNNLFYWNNFTNTSDYYVQDLNGTNYYNTTEGNIYYNVLNGSVDVRGNVSSSITGLFIGNLSTGVPYTNVSSLGKFSCNFAGCQDNFPLTNNSNMVLNTCTYSGSGNWTINLSDNCNITSSVNLGANYIIYNGSGTITYKNATDRIVLTAKGEKLTNMGAVFNQFIQSLLWKNYTG